LRLLTPSRKNMKHAQPKTSQEKELLLRRGLIETVNDQAI
ncbi:MAG: Transposase domain, partial [Pseudomonadota bacterium]